MTIFNKKFLSKPQIINILKENYHIVILFLIVLVSLFFNLFHNMDMEMNIMLLQ